MLTKQFFMHTYSFRFNNSKKQTAILFWFFTTLLTIPLTATILVAHSNPFFPSWLTLITFPLLLMGIYKLFKVASQRLSTEIISLSKEGFSSSCFGPVLFSEIHAIQVPVREMGLFRGLKIDYYKKTDAYTPYLEFSISTSDGKTLNWVLNEWGGLYNSEEDFSIFLNFLIALTDQLYRLYHHSEPYKNYLKILDEKGSWEKRY